ncbi:MAG: peptidoglycan DD-metalloendopeptidase family protein [Candidatus Sericytochromatia bacterium]|nr:peptidoglycan DD-metalloendopeptidase family protein [Candidatus Sericytochromatia bacterium]
MKSKLTVPGDKAPNARAGKKRKSADANPSVYVEVDLGNAGFDVNALFANDTDSIGSFVYHPEITAPRRQLDPYRVVRTSNRSQQSVAIRQVAATVAMAPVHLVQTLAGWVSEQVGSLKGASIGLTKPTMPSTPILVNRTSGQLPGWLIPAGSAVAVAGVSALLWLGIAPTGGPVVDQILAQNQTEKRAEALKLAAQPGVVNATRTRVVEYTVKAGDSITTLAKRFELNESTIRQVNGLAPEANLKAGKKMAILPFNGVVHTLSHGETALELAYRYSVSLAKLQSANPGAKMEHLRIGQSLIIPGVSYTKERAKPPVVVRHERNPEIRLVAYEPKRNKPVETKRSAAVRPTKTTVTKPADRGARSERSTPVSRSLPSGERTRPAPVESHDDHDHDLESHDNGRMVTPNAGGVSSGFGWRGGRLHAGIDIANDPGTMIKAARSGVVLSAAYDGAYGNAIVISHGNGVTTRYGHCSRLLVSPGQRVEAGQPIGAVGSTGRASGPHVHFEVRVNGNPVDPRGYL